MHDLIIEPKLGTDFDVGQQIPRVIMEDQFCRVGHVKILSESHDEVTVVWNACSLERVGLERAKFVVSTIDCSDNEDIFISECVGCRLYTESSIRIHGHVVRAPSITTFPESLHQPLRSGRPSCPHAHLIDHLFAAKRQLHDTLGESAVASKMRGQVNSDDQLVQLIGAFPDSHKYIVVLHSFVEGSDHIYKRHSIVSMEVLHGHVCFMTCSSLQCRKSKQKSVDVSKAKEDLCPHIQAIFKDAVACENIRKCWPNTTFSDGIGIRMKDGEFSYESVQYSLSEDDGEYDGVPKGVEAYEKVNTWQDMCVKQNLETGVWEPVSINTSTTIPLIPSDDVRDWAEVRNSGFYCKRDLHQGRLPKIHRDGDGYLRSDTPCQPKEKEDDACRHAQTCSGSYKLIQDGWFVLRTSVGSMKRPMIKAVCSGKYICDVDKMQLRCLYMFAM